MWFSSNISPTGSILYKLAMSNDKPEDQHKPEVVKQEIERIVERLRDQLAEIHQAELPLKDDPGGEKK